MLSVLLIFTPAVSPAYGWCVYIPLSPLLYIFFSL